MAKSGKALMTPEVLKWAREERIKLSIDYAAKKLKVAPEQLEAWEHGTDQPTFAQLKRIANFYKTHISIFYLPGPPTGFQPLTDHRSLPESLKINEDQAYRLNANILEAYERRETLIGLYELLEESPPQVTLKLSEADDPGYASQKIRSFLEFNRERLAKSKDAHAALKFWKQTVEAEGVLVCQTSANTHLSIDLKTARGFCIAQNLLPVIVVNSKDSPYGRIFTIIHELVHITLEKSVIQNTRFRTGDPPDLNPTEIFCNQVAAEVLAPKDELLEIVKPQSLENDLPKLSKHFHVSPEVIMRRLLTLEKISLQDYQEYRKRQQEKYKDAPASTGGHALYHKRLVNASGEHFARTAFMAYYEEKITLARLAAILSNFNTKHLSKIESAIFGRNWASYSFL